MKQIRSGNNAGSRNSDGNVPNVNFNSDNGKVNVNWYNPDNHNDNLRVREEVSQEKSHFIRMGFLV